MGDEPGEAPAAPKVTIEWAVDNDGTPPRPPPGGERSGPCHICGVEGLHWQVDGDGAVQWMCDIHQRGDVLGGNLHDRFPGELPNELVDVLASSTAARVERIVSRGHASPEGFWYDQDEHELVVLIAGAAELELADRDEHVRLGPGDWLLLPAHLRHRVAWTDPDQDTVWLAVFL